ncbi:hypothetical protein M406DRAFT_243809, partial [Cryphonectria parasitica EP155]
IFKFDLCIYKIDYISSAEFTKYVTETYPSKATSVVRRNGILQYGHTASIPPATRDFIKNQLQQSEWIVPDYDAVVSYWIRDP